MQTLLQEDGVGCKYPEDIWAGNGWMDGVEERDLGVNAQLLSIKRSTD